MQSSKSRIQEVMLLKDIKDLFYQIKDTSSLIVKKSIIKENEDNKLFLKVIKFLLDPNVITGINKKKIDKKVNCDGEIVGDFSELIDYLIDNNTGTDENIATVRLFLSNCSDKDVGFYKDIITKSFRLGCNVKLVNSAIPGLIPVWNVQLGSAYDKLKLKDGERFYLSRKLNGCRASYYHDKLISRQGKQFNGMGHILHEIHQLEKDLGESGWFIDGELIRKNIDNVSDGENFRIGMGIINSDAHSKEEIKFVIFDMFKSKDIRSGESLEKYSIRKDRLNKIRKLLFDKGYHHLEIVEMIYEGTDQSMIMHFLDEAVKNDW